MVMSFCLYACHRQEERKKKRDREREYNNVLERQDQVVMLILFCCWLLTFDCWFQRFRRFLFYVSLLRIATKKLLK